MWIYGKRLYDQLRNQGVYTHTNRNQCKQQQKATNNKKISQKNRKSRSVSIQLPEHPKTENKKSRSYTILLPEKPRSVRTPKNPMNTKIPVSEIEGSRSGEEASTPQCMASVARHLKNRVYINSGAFIRILFNKELFQGLVNLKSLSRFK